MRKTILFVFALLTLTVTLKAQAPEGFKYQAVVRDASNTILINQAVGLQLIIHEGSATGSAVYTETFSTTSNAYGMVNLEIGSGTTSNNFSIIDWGNNSYYIETAIDLSGGSSYTSMGTSQLLSVPYALHANTSGNTGTAEDAYNGTTAVNSTGAAVTIQSESINVTGPGKVIATGNVDVFCNLGCVGATDFVASYYTLSDSPTAPPNLGSAAFMYTPTNTTNSSSRTAVFSVMSPGTFTVYMRGARDITVGAGTEVGFYRGQISLVFIPE